jgi:UDP-N-acetylmuramoyl-L-alanyl-D-glutamate--2,6-diaminopimelate ligase
VPFRYVGFTNLAHDHLDYHQTWDEYQKAKLKLFRWKGIKACVVNADDPAAEFYLAHTTAQTKWTYSTTSSEPVPTANEHVWADKISTNMNGSSFNLHLGGEQERVRLQLPGLFSVENALCAASVCANLNLKIGTIVAGLENLDHVPGRLERIDSSKGFSVIIDYAHTPDSLEKLYSTLRPEVRGRMIAVLGSCGDRDKTKRPIMGALAARFCDLVYITDEEPYSEDPLQIIEEVSKGVPRGRALYKPSAAVAAKQEKNLFRKVSQDGEGEWWWKIPDRRQAIEKAIEQCKLDDLVLITGMGSQNFKIVNGKQEPWNDRLVVESILKEKNLMTKK